MLTVPLETPSRIIRRIKEYANESLESLPPILPDEDESETSTTSDDGVKNLNLPRSKNKESSISLASLDVDGAGGIGTSEEEPLKDNVGSKSHFTSTPHPSLFNRSNSPFMPPSTLRMNKRYSPSQEREGGEEEESNVTRLSQSGSSSSGDESRDLKKDLDKLDMDSETEHPTVSSLPIPHLTPNYLTIFYPS
jgi:hypothetical protein